MIYAILARMRTANLSTCVSLVILICVALFASTAAQQQLPSKLSDATFWQLVTEFSEGDGPFPSDNFISNERSYTAVLPDLKKRVQPGGVYLGVGPEQNFTYIAATRPRLAFIVDIRRQNLVEQLMYKALFELSADRGEFLSRLFSRRVPPGNPSDLEELLALLRDTPPDGTMFSENVAQIRNHLTGTHGFKLTTMDESRLEYILRAFYTLGPNINYNGPRDRNPNGVFPTFVELLLEAGPSGTRDNFLSSEENFQIVQKLQKDNMIIPLVGNFAGSLALRAVGDYLRKSDAAVSAFYVSNVEQYLFRDPDEWRVFYRNVDSLPRESGAIFIRTLLQKDTGKYSDSPQMRQGYRTHPMLYSVQDLISRFNADGIEDYVNAVQTGVSIEVEKTPQPTNLGIVIWPDLRPPSRLQAIPVSSSEIRLEWRNTGKGDKTAFQVSRQVAGEWMKPIHVDYALVCGSDPCVFRDSNVKAGTRYCYFIEAGTDYSEFGPPMPEEFGDASVTVCSTPK